MIYKRSINTKEESKAFASRCMKIYAEFAVWEKNGEYLKKSNVVGWLRDDNEIDWVWRVEGEHLDLIGKFDHEPTDKEIWNAICNKAGAYHRMKK